MTDSPTGFNPQPSQAVFRSLTESLRARGETHRTEATTGRAADIAAARDGAVAEVLDIEKRLGDLQTYSDTIALAQNRAGATQTALTAVEASTTALIGDATTALQDATQTALRSLAETARTTFGGLAAALNTSFAGRSLFAGDESDGPAISPAADLLAEARTAIAGAASKAAAEAALADLFDDATAQPVYRGGAGEAPAAEVAPGERVDHSVRADRQVLRDTLRGVATVAAALDPATGGPMSADDRRQLAVDAVGSLRGEISGLNVLRAEIGSAEARIEEVRVANQAEKTRLGESFTALVGRDTLEAASRMQAVEGQLETLFLTTARFSQLSLADFLR